MNFHHNLLNKNFCYIVQNIDCIRQYYTLFKPRCQFLSLHLRQVSDIFSRPKIRYAYNITLSLFFAQQCGLIRRVCIQPQKTLLKTG